MIKEKINDLVYEFILSEGMRIHPRFHISLLEPAPAIAKLDMYIEIEDSIIEYEVEAILDHRGSTGEEEYLVKWKGYNITENIWELVRNLLYSQYLL